MMRSLYSGVAGLKTHQTKMDVIGNNIANVNTTAFKASSVTFSDLMSQTTQSASGANAATGIGGVNARQIGLGVKSGAINVNITSQGSAQSTGNPFDIMITGDNFFVVSDGLGKYFTRDGSFYVDGVGNLCMTSTGYNVMGWSPDKTNPSVVKKDTVQPLRIMSTENLTYPPEATEKGMVNGILDKNDTDVNSAAGKFVNMNFYDALGYEYTARFTVKSTATEGEYDVTLEKILDKNGDDVDISAAGDIIGTGNTVTLKFDTDTGAFVSIGGTTDGTLEMKLTQVGANFADISTDWNGVSMFNNNGTSTLTATNGDQDGNYTGRKLGDMIGVSIQRDGCIYASYDNGMTKLLGQVATANFPNASGLEKHGDNLYEATMNSGSFDGIGVDVTASGGYMSTGVLEMSNVDLSAEFTEMITTQRGFQANSRIITVSDTLLEELTNLKR